MLLVTCTDMPDLCGTTPETCWAKYGSVSMKSTACKELALRMVLARLCMRTCACADGVGQVVRAGVCVCK